VELGFLRVQSQDSADGEATGWKLEVEYALLFPLLFLGYRRFLARKTFLVRPFDVKLFLVKSFLVESLLAGPFLVEPVRSEPAPSCRSL
jgi:hypothetical protein